MVLLVNQEDLVVREEEQVIQEVLDLERVIHFLEL